MTQVRWPMWAALAAGSAALVAVVVAGTRTTPRPELAPRSAVAAMLTPAPDGKPIVVVASETPPAIVDYAGVPIGLGEIEGVLPLEESGHGGATLRLRLLGDADGKPAAMKYHLWRLGVPESANWTAGDQIECIAAEPHQDVRWTGLAPGRYRLQCIDARESGVDPPEFLLGDGANEITLPVPNRRTFRMRLRLVDTDGVAIRKVMQSPFGGGGTFGCSEWPPSWATPREPKHEHGDDGYRVLGSGTACGRSGPWEPVVADAEGFFDLGTHRERSTESHFDLTDEFAADGNCTVRVSMDDATAVDSTLVGVAPRLDVLVAHVTCPDGTKLDPTTAKVEGQSHAIRCAWTPPADAWRTLPVRVKVVKDGCEPLTFDWTAATADAEHRLVAKPTESPK